MAYHQLFLVILTVIFQMNSLLCKSEIDEPICHSRYDFESKLLKEMVKLDFDMTILKERYSEDIENFKSQLKLTMEKLETVTRELERAQTSKVNELTTLGNDLKQEVDDKVQEIEATKILLQEDFEDLYKNVELKTDKKLQEIKEEALRPPVAFLVKTLSDTKAGKNKVLIFTESVINTDTVYDHSSGCFTAPVNGTYLFNLQLCYYNAKYIHVQMFADKEMIANAILYDTSAGIPCSTLNAVAILAQGSRVWAKLGVEYSSGNVFYQEEANRWAAFMGTLVN